MAESDDELEAFATRLGLNKSWKHGDHYDLTRNMRRQAVEAGAIEVDARTMVLLRKKKGDRRP
jgi:hypothetical protein